MPEPWRWRRTRIARTAIEIAARTAIAIRIGTTGEELPPLSLEAGVAGDWLFCCTPGLWRPGEPLSGLPCPVLPPP